MKQRKKKTRRRTDLRFSPVSCHHQSTQNQQTGRARHGQMCFLLCLEKYPGVLWRSFGPDVGEESSRDSFRFFGSSVFHGKWYIIPSLFLLFLSLVHKTRCEKIPFLKHDGLEVRILWGCYYKGN